MGALVLRLGGFRGSIFGRVVRGVGDPIFFIRRKLSFGGNRCIEVARCAVCVGDGVIIGLARASRVAGSMRRGRFRGGVTQRQDIAIGARRRRAEEPLRFCQYAGLSKTWTVVGCLHKWVSKSTRSRVSDAPKESEIK